MILFSKQVKFSLLLEWSLFLSFLCILTLITIALSIICTLKHRLFARKEWLVKGNKATTISLWSPGRVISADIGRELRPLCLVCCSLLYFDSLFYWWRKPGENHWPVSSHWQTLSHNVVSSTYCHVWGSNSQHQWQISTGNYKPNYHTITTMTALV